MSLVNQLTTVG